MTTLQRLLVLDAALCACECAIPRSLPDSELRDHAEKLNEWLDAELDSHLPVFGEFCKAQKEAVQLLAKNPQVFGGDGELNDSVTETLPKDLPLAINAIRHAICLSDNGVGKDYEILNLIKKILNSPDPLSMSEAMDMLSK